MTLLMEDVQKIRNRWQKAIDYSHTDLLVDIELLCSEVEALDEAWRASEEASFDAYREIARMTGLLLKAKKMGTLPMDLVAAIDAAVRTGADTPPAGANMPPTGV